MLLQDLFKEENKELTAAYSIQIDEESSKPEFSNPPENLQEVGFIFQVDEDGMMREDLMDIVISYRLTNLPVVMEVPTQLIKQGKLEVKYLIQLANNVDFSIALLPPGSAEVGDSLTVEEYKGIIGNTVDEIVSRANFDKFVYPVSNFFEYLMLENILGKEKLSDFRPENKYVQENFASILSKQDSDDFKALIRSKLYDFYGGEKEFNLMAQTMLNSVLSKAKEMYKSVIIQSIDHSQENKEQN